MDKSPSAKINIVMLGLVLYFLFAQNFLGRIVFSPFLNSLDTTNFLPWLLHLLVANIPTYAPLLIYFLYKLFTKSKQGPAEALLIRRLSLKNVLYVVIMGSTVVLLFIWADYGISFIGGGTPQLEVLIMPLGRQLIVGAVVASVLEELYWRGLMFTEYNAQKASFWKFAIASGVFFGLIHGGVLGVSVSTFAGILIYAPLIYLTRSIWAPILYHTLVNGINPTLLHFLNDKEDFDTFFPTFMLALTIILAILIPASIICAKKFWAHNKHNIIPKSKLPKESKSFIITFWLLIAFMVVAIFLFRI